IMVINTNIIVAFSLLSVSEAVHPSKGRQHSMLPYRSFLRIFYAVLGMTCGEFFSCFLTLKAGLHDVLLKTHVLSSF
ncbi:hypothetical protein L9F63_012963, partial [Diploptera punctata]